MSNTNESHRRVEWRKKNEKAPSQNLQPAEREIVIKICLKIRNFMRKAWELGLDDPRKVIHCFKVGIALTIVSLFYYMRPLDESFGGNAIWAVMTVVVVFEYTVGAIIGKCFNRVAATFLAGLLAVGVHWVATQSGDKITKSIIIGVSVFLLASAVTFSRFIPEIKARFDYGAMIFILTYSLVAISGYRVEKLFDLAHQRLSTILIGTSICVFISMLISPIWAGEELHRLITSNMDKLANFLDCCVADYFNNNERISDPEKRLEKMLEGFKCVLNSKTMEESMAGFARWEPAHGHFSFQHPWKQYLKIGASIRNCAYCMESLSSCLISGNQVPEFIKRHLSEICWRVGRKSSSVIRELAINMITGRKSCKLDVLSVEMNNAVEELQNNLETLSGLLINIIQVPPKNENGQVVLGTTPVPLLEVIPIATFASLLIEIVSRIQGLVDAVEGLGSLANFKPDENTKQNQLIKTSTDQDLPEDQDQDQNQDQEAMEMEVLQKV